MDPVYPALYSSFSILGLNQLKSETARKAPDFSKAMDKSIRSGNRNKP